MKDILVNCYYDKMTKAQAVEFVRRCYNGGDPVPQRTINAAVKLIKDTTGEDWR